MNLRHLMLFIVATIILTACSFTMAADVTPPPDYIPPTPIAALGPMFPAQAPSTDNGAMIYAEKCAPCHGASGLGDGEQGIQLGVTVPAFGLPEIARSASPAQWYTTVTRGNMERFMPPFASLSDQERWDVVAYAMSLHMTEAEIAQGRELFETNCANCSTDFFTDQSKMSELSAVELARIVREGNDQVPEFGKALSDEEMWAVAAYWRTLSFDSAPVVAAPASTATPESVTVTETLSPTDSGTPAAEGTPVETEQVPAASEATAVVQAGYGSISGSIDNKTGEDLPSDLKVTLRAYEHGPDRNTGPEEVLSLEGGVEDGSFVFQNVEMPTNRIFIAELNIDGINRQSGFGVVKEGDTAITLPPITLYNSTDDITKLVIDEVQIFFEYGTDSVQVYNVYSFRNPGTEMVIVTTNPKGEIPFIKAPEDTSGLSYEMMQGSESIRTQTGLAIPPGEDSYGLIAFTPVQKAKKFEFSQEFVLAVPAVTVFVPSGVTVKSEQSNDLGVQSIQDFNFQIYELNGVGAGDKIEFTVSGVPKEASTASTPAAAGLNQNLLLGVGALGVTLILAGAWMYLRDRNRGEDTGEEAEGDEFESSEDVMDAIIALDEQHRARKIPDEAYQKRRAELKDILKGMM